MIFYKNWIFPLNRQKVSSFSIDCIVALMPKNWYNKPSGILASICFFSVITLLFPGKIARNTATEGSFHHERRHDANGCRYGLYHGVASAFRTGAGAGEF